MISADEMRLVNEGLDNIRKQALDRVNGLEAQVHELQQKAATIPAGNFRKAHKTLGAAALEHPEFKAFLDGAGKGCRVTLEAKNAITQDAGSPLAPTNTFAEPTRAAGILANGARPLQVAELFQTVPADSNQVSLLAEGASINGAAGQANEGALKAETDLVFDLRTRPIVTLATHVSVSEQALADAGALRQFIDARLAYFLRQRHEYELLRGGGGAGAFSGLSAMGNHVDFDPTTGDTALDSLGRAIEAVWTAGFTPNAVVLHPADWAAIERAKVAGGGYLLGDGGAAALFTDGLRRSAWGIPVVTSTQVEPGKFYAGDFVGCGLHFSRQEIVVEAGWVNDQFKRNMLTLRAEMRAALVVGCPAAVRYGDLTV